MIAHCCNLIITGTVSLLSVALLVLFILMPGQTNQTPSSVYSAPALAQIRQESSLTSLNTGSADWMATGQNTFDCFGLALAAAGDVNGDGYADVIVGAYGHNSERGQAYVYLGSISGLRPIAAFTASGENAGDDFGWSVASVGDVNGDGYADVMIGAPSYGSSRGRVYLYYGSATGLTTTAGVTLTGATAGDQLGRSIAFAGDVNGDGYADVIVGAPGHNTGTGRIYIFPGSASGLGITPTAIIDGDSLSSFFGQTVAFAGDVNGDGYGDVVVGAYGLDNYRGGAYLYGGSATGLDSTAMFTATGENAYDYYGYSVASAGDVNGDGYADVVIGAYGYNDDQGQIDVYHGSASGLLSAPAVTLMGQTSGDGFGGSASFAGDVNGDGYADIIVGAGGSHSQQGQAYIYQGSSTGLATTPAITLAGESAGDGFGIVVAPAGDVNGDGCADVLSDARDYGSSTGRVYAYDGGAHAVSPEPVRTFTGAASYSYFGIDANSAGDVNGDGYSDVIVGAYGEDNYTGRAYVYYGSNDGVGSVPTVTLTGEITNSYFGGSVASAGDVNGDGYSDVIVGAFYYLTYTGRAYVYYGSPQGLNSTPGLTLTGEGIWNSFGVSVASAGDVNGDGYGDIVVGANRYNSYTGRAYVYYGGRAGLNATPALTLTGENTYDSFGYSVAAAGDINNDGYGDVLVGAFGYNNGHGRVYVYHGGSHGLSPVSPRILTGAAPNDNFGYAAAMAGDVNGDGYGDVIVGADRYASYTGQVYVFQGGSAGLNASPTITFTGTSPNSHFGHAVASAGDVNDDGYGDVIIGAPASNGVPGQVSMYQGGVDGLASLPAATLVGAINVDYGATVAPAGDVNGDGYSDLVIGAYRYNVIRGQVFLHQGNTSDARTRQPRAWRAESDTPVSLAGQVIATDTVRLSARAFSPQGRSAVKLQWQLAPIAMPFTATGVISGLSPAWIDSLTAGATLTQTVSGLAFETRYHWRIRVIARPVIAVNPAVSGDLVYVGPWLTGNAFFTALSGEQIIAAAGPIDLLGASSFVTVMNQGSLSNLTLRDYPFTAHPQENFNGGGDAMLDRYYNLTANPGATNYNLTLCLAYRDFEVPSGYQEDQLRLCRWTGSNWTCLARATGSNPSADVVCAGNVTALSEWAIGATGPTAIGMYGLTATAHSNSLNLGVLIAFFGVLGGIIKAVSARRMT